MKNMKDHEERQRGFEALGVSPFMLFMTFMVEDRF